MSELTLDMVKKWCEETITEENWYKDRECTIRLDEQFSKRAEQCGYRAQYRYHPKEFLKLDMVWWKGDRMVAAIEYQNTFNKRCNPIEEEWKKLAHVDADYKILVTFCSDEDWRNDALKRAREIIATNPRNKEKTHYYLLFGEKNVWRFRGYEFDENGR